MEEWHEWGDFFISFGHVVRGGMPCPQTRAYDCQDGKSITWEGIVKYALLKWIFDQASRYLPSARSALAARQGPPPTIEQLGLAVEALQLAEVQTTRAEGGTGGPGHLEATGRLRLQRPASAEANYRVDLILVRQPDRPGSGGMEELHVATQTGKFGAGLTYDIRLTFPVPGVGRYRLKSAVALLPSGKPGAEAEGPLLRVE